MSQPSTTSPRLMRLVALFLILLATAGCDQATKHLARTWLPLAESVTLPGHFMHLALAENPGAFLSLGASLSEVARNGVFTLGVALGLSLLLVYLLRTPGVDWLSFAGLALVWAGGTSNLWDRLTRHGLVTDFMVVQAGPFHTGVFNVADMAVMAGVLLVLAASRLHFRKGKRPEPSLPA